MTCIISIRSAKGSDHVTLAALYRRSSLANDADREILSAHPDALKLPMDDINSGGTMVVECGGVIVGFSTIVPMALSDAELSALFVEPDSWKKGCGRMLVKKSATQAHNNCAKFLSVDGNPNAKGFFEACGFESAGIADTEFGPGLRMRLNLSRAQP